MGLARKETLTAGTKLQEGGQASTESGTSAAVERLKKALPKSEAHSGYKQRDFEKEAIGKTRCVQFEAALQSPAIAGMKFDTMEQYLALVKQAAEAGVAYTFGA